MCEEAAANYFAVIVEATLLNVAAMFVPRLLAAAMIAIEIREAINPYSITVAPLSSARKARVKSIMRNTRPPVINALACPINVKVWFEMLGHYPVCWLNEDRAVDWSACRRTCDRA